MVDLARLRAGLFLFAKMSRNWPLPDLSHSVLFCHNGCMEQMEKLLEKLEIPAETSDKAIKACAGDEDKITQYLIACLARYDDSHEYLD